MKLKRQFGEDGACTHVDIVETGTSPEQNFSHRLVEDAVSAGWMKLDEEGGTLTIVGKPEDLLFKLVRTPGYYCRSTGERIPISAIAWGRMQSTRVGDLTQREARAWLARKQLHPQDYEVTNAYECVLNAEQHEKFRAVKAVSGNLVAAYLAEAAGKGN